jgi:hypothetical protein
MGLRGRWGSFGELKLLYEKRSNEESELYLLKLGVGLKLAGRPENGVELGT